VGDHAVIRAGVHRLLAIEVAAARADKQVRAQVRRSSSIPSTGRQWGPYTEREAAENWLSGSFPSEIHSIAVAIGVSYKTLANSSIIIKEKFAVAQPLISFASPWRAGVIKWSLLRPHVLTCFAVYLTSLREFFPRYSGLLGKLSWANLAGQQIFICSRIKERTIRTNRAEAAPAVATIGERGCGMLPPLATPSLTSLAATRPKRRAFELI
jgi:hypothetical protein